MCQKATGMVMSSPQLKFSMKLKTYKFEYALRSANQAKSTAASQTNKS